MMPIRRYSGLISVTSLRWFTGALPLAIVLALAASALPSIHAQTFTVLHSFEGPPNDGSNSYAGLIRDGAGNLYGTTVFGGASNLGTVFKLEATGTFTVLYNFTGGTDGSRPYAPLVMGCMGDVFGTTSTGGGSTRCQGGCGTVFKVDQAGKETVLRVFNNGGIGGSPHAGLLLDSVGNLYGTATQGGGQAYGNVFKLDPTGKETVLYSFQGPPTGTDGTFPYAGLIRDAAGNFYGTTSENGVGAGGSVYRLDKNNKETVLYSFTGPADGHTPTSVLIRDAAGNLYGTTSAGGAGVCTGRGGCGTVFKLDAAGNETVLYNFTGGADGANPFGGLVRDAQGNLYGTTFYGGATQSNPCDASSLGCGVIFKLDKNGKETVLYTFTDGDDGASPNAGLIRDAQGNFYGTTAFGGNKGDGVVFKFTP